MVKQGRSLRRQTHRTRNAIVAATIALAAIAAVAYVVTQPSEGGTITLVEGDKAPLFTLNSVNGSSFSLGNYVGKSDVLLFFNEGLMCSPCLQQMVAIDANYSAFNKMGVLVVSVTTDSASSLGAWAQNNGIAKMPVLSDPSLQVEQEYDALYAGSMHPGMTSGHTFILVDRSGSVVWRKDYGYSTMYVPMSELIAAVRAALG